MCTCTNVQMPHAEVWSKAYLIKEVKFAMFIVTYLHMHSMPYSAG